MYRGPVEEGLYEVDTINLLSDVEDKRSKLKALDRTDLIIEWLNGFTRRQLRVYKDPVAKMLLTIKHILEDVAKDEP